MEDLAETLIQYGADHVYLVEDPRLAQYRTIVYTHAIEQLIRRFKPNILLMGATHIGRDLAPRVSRPVRVAAVVYAAAQALRRVPASAGVSAQASGPPQPARLPAWPA